MKKKRTNLDPVLLAGDVKGGEPVQRPTVGIRLPVQQHLGHPHVSAVGRHVQRRQIINCNLKCEKELADFFKIGFTDFRGSTKNCNLWYIDTNKNVRMGSSFINFKNVPV